MFNDIWSDIWRKSSNIDYFKRGYIKDDNTCKNIIFPYRGLHV